MIQILKRIFSRGEISHDDQNVSQSFGMQPVVNLAQSYNPYGSRDNHLPADHDAIFDMYDRTLRDNQVASVFQQRRLALTSTRYNVTEGADDAISKQAAEALHANLDAIPFDQITDLMCYGIFYGYAVGEILWRNNNGMIWIDDIRVRRARRFGFNADNDLILRPYFGQPAYTMPQRKFWTYKTGGISSDDLYGRGLAYYLHKSVHLKNHGMESWSALLGKYGIPTAVGKLPKGATEEVRRRLLDVVAAIHSSSGMVVPEGIEIELLEAMRGGTVSFDRFIEIINDGISKIILSQTMTTDSGSSLSQAQVHMEVRAEVVKADASLITSSFNDSVVRWWCEWNFPTATSPRLEFMTDVEEALTQRATRDKMIADATGYRLTLESVKEIYGGDWIDDKDNDNQQRGDDAKRDTGTMQQSRSDNATADRDNKKADAGKMEKRTVSA